MKKKTIIILLSALIVFSSVFYACNDSSSNTDNESTTTDMEQSNDKIAELEAMIQAILKDQQASESEKNKQLEELRVELEKLQQETHTDKSTAPEVILPNTEFKYTITNGMACITEIITIEENIIIPYTLDGYKVYSIGSEVLSSQSVKSITVSSGIEKIDWFAFKNCPQLSSVTIPETVRSIGYGAFDNSSSAFVLRCSRDSFAHRYAQSYGLTYDIT